MTVFSRLFLSAAVSLGLLAGPAAHAFSIQPMDSSSARSALTDQEERLAPHDNGDGTVTTRFGNGESTFSFGTVMQSGRAPGYLGLTPAPWQAPMPWPPAEGNVRR